MKILIVDDEKDILEFLSYNLEKEGYQVSTALNGVLALDIAKKIKPDLIILDVMMPEMDGISTCSELRKIPETQNSLILFLTARSEEYSELAGFNAGADDYVTKPIKPKLLISRIKALLKRNKNNESSSSIKIEDIEIDKERHVLMYRGEEIHLARKEFNLLYYLMTIPGKVFTREEIISEVWNDAYVGDRTIDVHVRKIREKTGSNYIKTIKGVGYKFDI
ncbi:MAG: response regulator transcription factor [Flavobacteriales bacterium]|nr:response regulator transcription factor [Flavobacteriales bacterium]|tara:strand:- start:180 stop:842 length:663 start_codon:yes stop_codon:yes gene_type:complete